MIYGLVSLLFSAVIIFFAVIGIRETVKKHPALNGMLFIRDFFKYLALFIAVVITCFGLAGILTYTLNYQIGEYTSKLDLARWLSFSVIGIPLLVVLARWLATDFKKHPQASYSPVWQIYLLSATSTSLILWFLPLQNALRAFAGAPYSPRAVSQAAIAFITWVVHINLLRGYKARITNALFFIGSFVGFTGLAISLISFIDSGISTVMGIEIGKYQLAEAIILLITSLPLALYYFGEFGNRASDIELRIFSTFGGLFTTILFVSIAATVSLTTTLTWYFGETVEPFKRFFADLPAALGAVIVLTIFHFVFRTLVSGYKRDVLVRVYQYLISAGTLIAGSVGFGAVLVGLLANQERANTVIFGLSLMVITLSNWFYHWELCQSAWDSDARLESQSAARRFYIYFFIGGPLIIGISSLVWLTFNGFKAILLNNQEWWQSRYPIACLATTLILALYHYRVLIKDRAVL